MDNSRRIGISILLLFFLLFPITTIAADSNEKAQFMAFSNWAISANPSVLDYGYKKDAVENFLNSILNSPFKLNTSNSQGQGHTFTVRLQDLEWDYNKKIIRSRIGDYRWIDLDSDNTYELLVTADFSGRPFYNNLFIVKKNNNSFNIQQINTWQIEKLDGTKEDLKNCQSGVKSACFKGIVGNLDNDTNIEIIVRQNLTEYRGSKPMAIWPVVYKLDKTKYIDKSNKYRELYENIVLPEIDNEIVSINKILDLERSSAATDVSRERKENAERLEEELSAKYLVRDKISRVIGDNPQVGLEKAITWSKSSKVNYRKNAISVFTDIKGEKSYDALWMLTLDKDPSVAELAKHALDKF